MSISGLSNRGVAAPIGPMVAEQQRFKVAPAAKRSGAERQPNLGVSDSVQRAESDGATTGSEAERDNSASYAAVVAGAQPQFPSWCFAAAKRVFVSVASSAALVASLSALGSEICVCWEQGKQGQRSVYMFVSAEAYASWVESNPQFLSVAMQRPCDSGRFGSGSALHEQLYTLQLRGVMPPKPAELGAVARAVGEACSAPVLAVLPRECCVLLWRGESFVEPSAGRVAGVSWGSGSEPQDSARSVAFALPPPLCRSHSESFAVELRRRLEESPVGQCSVVVSWRRVARQSVWFCRIAAAASLDVLLAQLRDTCFLGECVVASSSLQQLLESVRLTDKAAAQASAGAASHAAQPVGPAPESVALSEAEQPRPAGDTLFVEPAYVKRHRAQRERARAQQQQRQESPDAQMPLRSPSLQPSRRVEGQTRSSSPAQPLTILRRQQQPQPLALQPQPLASQQLHTPSRESPSQTTNLPSPSPHGEQSPVMQVQRQRKRRNRASRKVQQLPVGVACLQQQQQQQERPQQQQQQIQQHKQLNVGLSREEASDSAPRSATVQSAVTRVHRLLAHSVLPITSGLPQRQPQPAASPELTLAPFRKRAAASSVPREDDGCTSSNVAKHLQHAHWDSEDDDDDREMPLPPPTVTEMPAETDASQRRGQEQQQQRSAVSSDADGGDSHSVTSTQF